MFVSDHPLINGHCNSNLIVENSWGQMELHQKVNLALNSLYTVWNCKAINGVLYEATQIYTAILFANLITSIFENLIIS